MKPTVDAIASASTLLQEYNRLQLQSPSTAHQALLVEAWELLEAPATAPDVSRNVVELAFAILWRRHALGELVDLFENYLRQSLELEDEAWARWHFVDILAIAHRCEETVAAHKEFISWAKATLPAADLPEVLKDSTQLACWHSLGLTHEWIDSFWEMLELIENTEFNRADRFELLRTAAMALEVTSGPDEARKAFRLTESLLEEEGGEWEGRFHGKGAFLVHKAIMAGREGDIEGMREQFQSIYEWLSKSSRTDWEVRSTWHNLASGAYFSGQYDLAVPAFEQAEKFEEVPGHTYLWHAAAIWKTTSDRSKVCELLSEAAKRLGNETEQLFLATKEFEGEQDDVAFRKALGLD